MLLRETDLLRRQILACHYFFSCRDREPCIRAFEITNDSTRYSISRGMHGMMQNSGNAREAALYRFRSLLLEYYWCALANTMTKLSFPQRSSILFPSVVSRNSLLTRLIQPSWFFNEHRKTEQHGHSPFSKDLCAEFLCSIFFSVEFYVSLVHSWLTVGEPNSNPSFNAPAGYGKFYPTMTHPSDLPYSVAP